MKLCVEPMRAIWCASPPARGRGLKLPESRESGLLSRRPPRGCGEPQKLDTLELVLALFFAVFRVYIFCGKETR